MSQHIPFGPASAVCLLFLVALALFPATATESRYVWSDATPLAIEIAGTDPAGTDASPSGAPGASETEGGAQTAPGNSIQPGSPDADAPGTAPLGAQAPAENHVAADDAASEEESASETDGEDAAAAGSSEKQQTEQPLGAPAQDPEQPAGTAEPVEGA